MAGSRSKKAARDATSDMSAEELVKMGRIQNNAGATRAKAAMRRDTYSPPKSTSPPTGTRPKQGQDWMRGQKVNGVASFGLPEYQPPKKKKGK